MRSPAFCCGLGSLCALAIWTLTPAAAQTPANTPVAKTGSLSGTVLDSVSRRPVAYATIVLLPAGPASKPLTGVAANDQGNFTLTQLAAGTYRLQVSFVGYAPRAQTVVVTDRATALGTILLPPTTQRLAEAVVLGTKPVVEVRPDRLVYNADQDVTNAGGTAQDVLRKAPLLAVDGDGNLRMRGASNFKVLVNNRPSPSLARNLAEALRGIPAEQIQRVEVITTPPAKYDGEGTAGIINIVLKKATSPGLNGRLGASGGNRNANLNSALNYKRGKIGFTSSLSAGLRHSPSQTSRERLGFSGQGTDILQQTSVNSNTNRSYYGTLGLDFDPAPHHSFSLAGSVQGYQSTIRQDLLSRDTPLAGTGPGTLFIRPIDNQAGGLNAEGTSTYTHTFAQARREWSVLGQYALNNGTFGYDFDQYNGSAIILEQAQASYRERSRGRTPSHEVTAQTDYTQPLGSKHTLELGLKAIWRRTASLADVDTLTPGSRPDFTRAPGRGTNFGYAQDVQAAYAIYAFIPSKKLSLSFGSRLERTALAADFRASNTSFTRSYVSLLPTGSARYTLSEATSLRLAYGRRITRPFIDYLNPFVFQVDPKNSSFGNPELAPELTDSYELGYATTIKKATVSVTGSVRHTGNAIEQIRLPTADPSVTTQTYANAAANTFYQLSLFGSLKPTTQWDVSVGADAQFITRRSAFLGTSRQGATAALNLNTAYRFPKKLTVQAFVYGAFPIPELQGYSSANVYYTVGAKKTVRDRVDFTLTVINPFNAYFPYRSRINTAYFDEHTEFRLYLRAVRADISYRFGQAQQSRPRKQIRNDDQKGGSSKAGG